MADLTRTIAIVFNGEDNTGPATSGIQQRLAGLEAAASGFGSAFKGMSQDIERATQPIADFTGGALKLEAGILAAGTAITLFAAKTAGDFDAAFRQISTLFDASDSDVKRFRDAVQDYAAGSSKSMQDVMASFSAAIGAGVDYRQSIDLISQAERLSVATRADLKGTTEVLVSTINSYGFAAKDAGKVSDILFQIIKDGKIEMGDLSRSLAMVTPIAATAGVKLEEIGAAIATLTAAGMQPSSAIEYLRSALTNIIKPSDEAEKMAKALGIQFDAQALKSKGLAGVLNDVARATKGNVGQISVLIGDVGGLTAAMTLTGAQADNFKGSLGNMAKAAGATGEAYAKMAQSMDVELGKVKSAFTGLMVSIGDPLLDEFGGIAASIAAIFRSIGASVKDGALNDLVAYLESKLAGLDQMLKRVAENLPAAFERADLSGFKRGIDAVAGAFGVLFDGIDITTVDGLTRAIELAGAAFLGLSNFTAGAVESFRPVLEWLVKMADGLAEADTGFFKTAGSIAGFATQANILAGSINSLMPAIEAFFSLLLLRQGVGLVGALSGAATAAGAAGLAGALGSAGLVAAAGAAGYAIGTTLNDPINALVSKLTGSQTTLGGWIYDITHAGEAAEKAGEQTGGATGSWEENATAVTKSGAAHKKAGDWIEEFKASVSGLDSKMSSVSSSSTKMAEAAGTIVNHGVKMVPIIDAATGKIVGYDQAVTLAASGSDKLTKASGGTKDAIDKAAKSADDAKKKTDEYRLKLEEIASNERIKTIEARVNLNIAQLQTDAEKVKAIFASLDNTVGSTGDLLGTLFDKLGTNMETLDKYDVKNQIELENKRRQDALDLQKELTRATIDEIRARTRAMEQGDALIKINGDGLAPHLEAFMWEILKQVQTRVNRDGLSMLLGM